MFEISVAGLRFESDPTSYDHAFVVEPDGLTGWYDSVETKGETFARPVAHGDFDLPVFRTGRMITIAGNVLATSEFDLKKARDRLMGLLADGSSAVLTVDDSDAGSWARVRLSGAPKFAPHPSGLEGAFQVSFKATDPRMYGSRRQFSGSSVSVHHMGNFPASPVVEVVGPRAAYTVTGPGGKQFQVTTALPAGQTDRIDLRTGKLTRNGSVAVGVVGRADVWTIPPGKQSTMSISVGSMTVNVTDTYM